MPEQNNWKFKYVAWSRRLVFDRMIGFLFFAIGILFSAPLLIWSGSVFFLLAAIDAHYKNKAEKQIEID
jgi:hypothetical protein